ncbi:MAG: hydroxymethylbilane synthase [Acidobacteria bacterium 13_1_40CM_4_69_4]|nr:MAG: hydroxymethylbilane synthase [Acidobacteria bacterium 13_1_40CM_4_69_4]
MRTLVIGSRGSRLALWQAEWARARLERAGSAARIEVIHTSADQFLDRPLAAMGGKGVFVKEIEEALLSGAIDLAAHSLKDLPTVQPPGLSIACVPPREDPRDVLLAPGAPGLAGLARGALVGTGSPRRASQLHALRPDLRIADLRGNVDTRLARLRHGDYDAVLLASAGLRRLGIQMEGTALDFEQMIPAVGQGAMAIEIRSDDRELEDLLKPHHHAPTAAAVTAERAFLRGLGGGCRAPIAAVGEVDGARLLLRGLVAGPGGAPLLKDRREGPVGQAEAIGGALAVALLSRGAGALVRAAPAPLPQAP